MADSYYMSRYSGEETDNLLDLVKNGEVVGGTAGVSSFNGRSGVVMPQSGDYTADMVGAESIMEKGRANGYVPLDNNTRIPMEYLYEEAVGQKGDKGDDGSDFKILGYYDTLGDLEAYVPNPNPGDSYGVGLLPPYDIYVWDGVNQAWKNNGPLSAMNKIDKVSGATAGNIPVLTADGQLQDSGKSIDDVGATVPGATPGNFASFGDSGKLEDSGKRPNDFAPAPLSSNLTLYVNALTGDDGNDGLSAERPKKTIMGAVNLVPKCFSEGRAIINVADGTYSETVVLSDFYGSRYSNDASIKLVGSGSETCHITGGIRIDGNTAAVCVQNVLVSGDAAGGTIRILGSLLAQIYNVSINADAGGQGIRVELGSCVASSFEVNNANTAAVFVTGGTAYVNSISGSNNAVGLQSGASGNVNTALVIAGDSITISAGAKYKKLRGSAIIENGVLV